MSVKIRVWRNKVLFAITWEFVSCSWDFLKKNWRTRFWIGLKQLIRDLYVHLKNIISNTHIKVTLNG